MPIRVLIAASQDRERIVLRYLLERIKALQIVGEVTNALDALVFCQEQAVDLVIFDTDGSELEMRLVAAIVALQEPPQLALLGSAAVVAVQAFEIGALDYVPKPLNLERLERTITRARERCRDNDYLNTLVQSRLKESLDLFWHNYQVTEKAYHLVPVRSKGKITLLQQDDIVYCESQAKKVSICTKNETHLSNFTLNELAAKLNQQSFFRAHPAFIVNLDYVKEILNFGEGSYILRMQYSQRDIILSRSRAKLLRQRLNI
jgi:two-component system LytT family response regulator/two-component system response regulator LytT